MPTVLGLTTADSKVSKNDSMGGKNRLDTISKRNHHAAIEVETLFWRALVDSPDAAKEYMSEDCVMINPLFADGDAEPMSKKTDPSIDKILDGAENGGWTSYRMHGTPAVVEIDLMAVSVLYKLTLYRKGDKDGKLEEYEATCHSCWRQTAGADWLLVSQMVAYAD
ncbi:hypothetical protein NKR19_g2695 [Coniochaeta hoffmannii]|uniref:DUF4440 domain-containing protein n=1 Tax=Coniochaeta hoffmannii TaxID=91930 RepID=A0AA38SG39_9PEZI|nr:hypothetical protein NKR19_g2695 [Coniochaeta hoffmannii]